MEFWRWNGKNLTGFADRFLENGNSTPAILTIYFAFVLIRFVVSLMMQNPLVVSDELVYKNMALSFFSSGSFQDTPRPVWDRVQYLPRLVYPVLISPSFLFGENFFPAMKLINALLMNAAIFPLYKLAREFMNKRSALIICIVVLTLPCFNFVNFVMVECVTLPLFLAFFYFAFKTMTTMRPKYAILTSLCLGINLLNKPTALLSVGGLVCSCVGVIIFYLARHNAAAIKRQLVWINIFLFFSIAAYFLIGIFFPDTPVRPDQMALAIYKRLFQRLSWGLPQLRESIQMTLAHFNIVFLIYLIPFYVMVVFLIQSAQSRSLEMDRKTVFAIMVFSFVLVYIGGVARMSLSYIGREHYGRIHGRYFFNVYPLFVLAFATFPAVKWGFRERLILFVSGTLVGLTSMFVFLPKYVYHGITIVDDPSFAWYVFPNRYLIIPIALTFIVSLLYYALSNRPSRRVFLGCLLCYSFIGNLGEVNASIYYDYLNTRRIKPIAEFVRCHISEADSRVVSVEPVWMDQLLLAFKSPLNFIGTYKLPKGTRITRKLIPKNAEYLVLFDEYELDFPVESVVTKGPYKIITLQKSNNRDQSKSGL